MRMSKRTRLRVLLALVAASAGFGLVAPAAPASAVCGGGAPGEPCHCPSGITILKWTIGEVQC